MNHVPGFSFAFPTPLGDTSHFFMMHISRNGYFFQDFTLNRYLESNLQKNLLCQVPSQIWYIFLSGTLLSCCGIQPGDVGTKNRDFLISACPVTTSKMELSGSSSPAVITCPYCTDLPQCCFLLRCNWSADEGGFRMGAEWADQCNSGTVQSGYPYSFGTGICLFLVRAPGL